MQVLTSVKKIIDKIMEWLSITILAIMTVLVTYQVITRYFFNRPSGFSENVAQYLFVWLVMFGSAYLFGLREHLNISVLKDKFNPLMNLVVEILINISLFLFAAIVCVYGGYHITAMQMRTMDAATGLPMGFIYISIPISGVTLLFYAIYNICLSIQEYKAGVASGPAKEMK
jgi:TRAP-type C4-dicarboxylate transport system permease small subunit